MRVSVEISNIDKIKELTEELAFHAEAIEKIKRAIWDLQIEAKFEVKNDDDKECR